MRLALLTFGTVLLVGTLCTSNGKDKSTSSQGPRTEQKNGAIEGDFKPPENLDEALAILIAKLTPERRSYIEAGGEDYAFCAIDKTLLPNNLPFLGDPSGDGSTLWLFFLRKGIFDGEDMWFIINTAFSRKVRGKPIDLGKQIEDVRLHRAKGDEVFPLDLNCPHCGLEMRIEFALRLSTADPKRKYFIGHCPNGAVFFYYHKDGWKPESEIKDREQAAPSDGDKPSN
ncbi:MAG: hypothetical protein V4710_16515 [Verrucomicrobiota bacterium]